MKKTFFCIILLFSISFLYAEELPCLMCHSSMDTGKSVHLAVQMGCSVCHIAPHEQDEPELSLLLDSPDLCYMCHDTANFTKENQHTAVTAGMCTSCHNPHASEFPNLLVSEGSDLCYTCHDTVIFTRKFQHTPVTDGKCLSCHDPHSENHKDLLVAGEPDLCFSCHDSEEFTKQVTHKPVASGNCITCHDSHSSSYESILNRSLFKLCTSCHKEQSTGKHVIYKFGYNHPISGKADPGRPGNPLSCISCHKPHSSDVEVLFRGKTSKSEEMCFSCHT